MTRNPSRRSVLAGTGAAVAGLVGVGSQVAADGHDVPVVIASVVPDQDLIVLRNQGESEVDLSGYVLAWQYGNPDYNQRNEIPDGTQIAAGEELRITSGYYDTEADIDYGHGAGRIANEDTNIIALLTPSEQNEVSVYDTSSGETEPADSVDDEPEGGETDTEDEEPEEVEESEGEDETAEEESDEESGEADEDGNKSEEETEDEEQTETEDDDCPDEESAEAQEAETEDDCPEEEEAAVEAEAEEDDC